MLKERDALPLLENTNKTISQLWETVTNTVKVTEAARRFIKPDVLIVNTKSDGEEGDSKSFPRFLLLPLLLTAAHIHTCSCTGDRRYLVFGV